MLLDENNIVIAGDRYDAIPEEVISLAAVVPALSRRSAR
jgi:hypothetical protein